MNIQSNTSTQGNLAESDGIKITDDSKLVARTYPGGIEYTRCEDGQYNYRSFVLGGCGGGKHTASEVATKLTRSHEPELVAHFLSHLGWHDVIECLPSSKRL